MASTKERKNFMAHKAKILTNKNKECGDGGDILYKS